MRRRTAVRALSIALLLLAAGFAALFYWCSRPPGRGLTREFTVEVGWGARRIAGALADSGLVRCRYYFLWRYSGMDGRPSLQAGRYLLTDGMSPDSILGVLAGGEVIPVATSWVTLAPGLELHRSLEVIASSTELPLERLDSLAGDSAFLAGLGIPCLEGYLYPETYEFADTLGAVEVLARIVETGRGRWPERLAADSTGTGLSAHETVILASLVEREARVDEERPLVAGVFLGRLRQGMRLESCATVQYALGEVKEVLLFSDLRIQHPYNTYLNQGLPPGPICSPGQTSISAACSPDTTGGYLYFVSRDDGTGRHLFAATHSGHLQNIRSVRGT
ncbi:MAG: hypothetical protein AVO35_03285 [Candidatus Aegiribacteria sp. MLS_C]|nr:MAG: hypothetical protein AVO35_03285 [Candidatus Aegiribacteria sp. MLS_C]